MPQPSLPAVLRAAAVMLASAAPAVAGPYPPAAGRPGSNALAAEDPRFLAWAVEVTTLVRGPEEIQDPLSAPASYGSAASALGPADVLGTRDQPEPGTPLPKPSVSLGDGGSITLRFNPPISNGPGPDFAVFENGISFNGGDSFFMELAFVEVSSNGLDFHRFPAFSETQTSRQLGAYSAIDPTDLHNLAGKFVAGHGTPFDLAELAGRPGMDLAAVTHVRVIDVVGSLQPAYAQKDSLGRIINDPWPTFLTTSGFDLDAVGVLHQAVTTYAAWRASINWSSQNSDPQADPDGDGVTNLEEYAFNLPPLTPGPAPAPVFAPTPTGWNLTLPPVRPGSTDLVATTELSPNLLDWTSHPWRSPIALDLDPGGAAGFCRLHFHLLSSP